MTTERTKVEAEARRKAKLRLLEDEGDQVSKRAKNPYVGMGRGSRMPSETTILTMAIDNLLSICNDQAKGGQHLDKIGVHELGDRSRAQFVVKGFDFRLQVLKGQTQAEVAIGAPNWVDISEQKAAEILAILARDD